MPTSVQMEVYANNSGNKITKSKYDLLSDSDKQGYKKVYTELSTNKTVAMSDEEYDALPEKAKYSDKCEVAVLYFVKEQAFTISDHTNQYETVYTSTTPGQVEVHNILVPDTVNVKVVKQWNDDNDAKELRPDHITVSFTGLNTSAIITSEGRWTYTFENLDKYKNGTAIDYTSLLQESAIANYTMGTKTSSIEGNTITITVPNNLSVATTSVRVDKVWANDTEETRSDVTLHLYGETSKERGVVYVGEDKTIAKGDNPASVTWSDLPKTLNGEVLTWHVYEDAVPGYRTEYVRDTEAEARVENTNTTIWKVTNTYYGPVTEVKVKKVWNDNNNVDNVRPRLVELQLFRKVGNVEETEAYKTATIDKFVNNESEYVTWSNLPTSVQQTTTNDAGTPNDPSDDSVETNEVAVVYFVKEVQSDQLINNGYSAVVESTGPGLFTVTNTRAISTRNIQVIKTWTDKNNEDGLRPDYITVKLLADGEEKESVILTADNDWKYEFKDLPVKKLVNNDNGTPEDPSDDSKESVEIEYTVEEVDVPNYETNIVYNLAANTISINNSRTVGEKVSIKVRKIWNDAGHEDLRRDVNVLLQNSSEQIIKVGMIKLTDPSSGFDNNVQDADGYYEWIKLPKITKTDDKGTPDDTSDDVQVIDPAAYSIKEQEIQGYTSNVNLEKIEGDTYYFTITNTYNEDKETVVTYINPRAGENNMIVGNPRKYASVGEAQAASKDPSVVPSVPEYDGYDFLGWSSNYDPAVGFIMVATYNPKDVKLVTYVDPLAATPIVKSEYAQNPATVTDPSDPGHSGYTFDGWVETIDEAGNVIRVATFKCVCPSSGPCPINPSGYVPPRTGIQLGLASIMAIVTGVGVIISADIKR